MAGTYAKYSAASNGGGGGGGGGGITSINSNTNAAQTIAGGTGISVSSTGGTTTITNTEPATSQNAFTIVQPDTGTSPTATTPTSTLTLHNADGTIGIAGNSGTNTITLSTSGLQPTLTFSDSLVKTGTTVTLSNDTASPAASSYYGTNSSAVKGYYTLGSLAANNALSNLTSPTAINQSLLFGTDSTFNIGAVAGASRPLNVYASNSINVGFLPQTSTHPYVSLVAGASSGAANVMTFYSGGSGSNQFTSDSATFKFVNSGTGANVFQVNTTTSVIANQDFSTGANIFSTDTNHNVAVGNAALGTTATNGFFYIPTCAGAPTGTPTAKTGLMAMIYDTTNHKFWMYDTGTSTWKGVVLT